MIITSNLTKKEAFQRFKDKLDEDFPVATADTLGGVKVGENLSISDGVLSAADTTYSAATTSADGLMSASDKTKLDGIDEGATKTVIDSALDSTSANPVENKAVSSAIEVTENDIADIKAYLALNSADVLGLQVDYENKTFTRLAGAANLTAGTDFDSFEMYGGSMRCNVADDGTINAWYGDDNFTEDGSNGQVMIYRPKYYYKIVPLKLEPTDTGIGYHLRKANYYVSKIQYPGFKLHPAFYDADGNEIDYILESAYEGSLWDADGGDDGTGAYILDDSQVMNTTADKLCSIANVKPASGLSQSLTRPNCEALAQNRGTEWHTETVKSRAAQNLLMMIELGTMNSQSAVGNGVISISGSSSYNCSSYTGSTSSLGNATGMAESTINEIGGTETTYTENGKVAVTWRSKENPWGNIWKFEEGVNIYGNGSMGGGEPYICIDFNFAEGKNSDNYEAAGFTVSNSSGYISAMGYSENYDWLFYPSECSGNNALPVGDYCWVTKNLNSYQVALSGGLWNSGASAGAFYSYLSNGVGARSRVIGARLLYVPTKGSTAYTAAIASWKAKFEG